MMILAGCVFMLAIGVGCMTFLFDMRLRALETARSADKVSPTMTAMTSAANSLAAQLDKPAKKATRTSMANLRANLAAERTEKQAKEERVMEFRG